MTPTALIALVASAYGLSAADLTGRSRRRYITDARQAAAWVLRRAYPNISLSEIGRMLGGRDHTTVIYSIQKIEAQIADDVSLRAELHSLLPQQPGAIYHRPRRDPGAAWWLSQSRDRWEVLAA